MGTRRDHYQLIRSFRVLLLLACTACGDWSGGSKGAVAAAASDRLVGSWEARFLLSDGLRGEPSLVDGVHGRLIFVRIKSARSFPDLAAPVEYGLYDIDFSPYGFDSRVGGDIPTAIARISTAPSPGVDSLFIVLDPERRGVVVLMRGQLHGNRADGVWTAMSSTRSGIGESGTFAMTRDRNAQN